MSFLEIIGFAFLGFCFICQDKARAVVAVAKKAKIRASLDVNTNIKAFQK